MTLGLTQDVTCTASTQGKFQTDADLEESVTACKKALELEKVIIGYMGC